MLSSVWRPDCQDLKMSCASQKFPRVVAQIVTGPLGKSASVATTPFIRAVASASSVVDSSTRIRLRADLDRRAWDAPRFEEAGTTAEGVEDDEGVPKLEDVTATDGAGGAGGGAGGTDGVSGMEGVTEADLESIALSVGKNSLIPLCLDMVARDVC